MNVVVVDGVAVLMLLCIFELLALVFAMMNVVVVDAVVVVVDGVAVLILLCIFVLFAVAFAMMNVNVVVVDGVATLMLLCIFELFAVVFVNVFADGNAVAIMRVPVFECDVFLCIFALFAAVVNVCFTVTRCLC